MKNPHLFFKKHTKKACMSFECCHNEFAARHYLMKSSTIEFENEVKAQISVDTGLCSSVQILNQQIVSFGPAEVNDYLKRNFPPRRAVAACIGWKEAAGLQMNEEYQMLG